MRVRILEPTIQSTVLKKKVCAYARVSTNSDEQEESLENQIQYYSQLIQGNPEYTYVGVFSDQGISGTTDHRPQFQEMIELCRKGEIDLILTKSISRFARNTTIILEYVRELKLLGVEIHFEKDNIRTLSKDGELMLTVLSAFAAEESRNISENLKWRFHKKFQCGELHVNTSRFLGYDKDQYGDLTINPKEGKIIKRIFDDYLAGAGIDKIARQLNADKVPTIGNKSWYTSTILGILKNEKYMGNAILQKYYSPRIAGPSKLNENKQERYYVEENHSPIIPRDIWDEVQLEIKRRALLKGNDGSVKYTTRYPLTGQLYCSKCHSPLIRRVWNAGKTCQKVVWQCRAYIKLGKSTCTGTDISEAELEGVNITGPIMVKEWMRDGKKHYSYASHTK